MRNIFLASEQKKQNYNQAKVIIQPIPLEQTTSYHKGTKKGPLKLIQASNQLETYDSELECEPINIGIYTTKPLISKIKNPYLEISKSTQQHIQNNKWILSIGGEHSITPSIIKAYKNCQKKEFAIIQLDAHFDLRDQYQNISNSHACALKRSLEHIKKSLSIGIRLFSKQELDFAQKNNILYILDKDLKNIDNLLNFYLKKLPQDIYLSLDLDFFSPAEIPGVGTPVPGGPMFWEGLKIIKTIFQTKNVIGMDIVELCPKLDPYRSPFTSAMIAYKSIGYKFYL